MDWARRVWTDRRSGLGGGQWTGAGGVVEGYPVETEGPREVAARGGWRGCPAGVLGPRCPAWLGSTESGLGMGAMQMLRRSPGGRCLRGVLLGLAKLGHCSDQVEETGHQRGNSECAVAADVADQCKQRSGGAQPVSAAGVKRDTSVGWAGGPVIGVCRPPQLRVTQRPGCRMEDVGRRGRVPAAAVGTCCAAVAA
jgi:hypothetical protein